MRNNRFDERAGVTWVAFRAVIATAACSMMLGGCGILFQNHEKRADAVLTPTVDTARGTITLIERADGVQVSYNLTDMPPNSEHALEVHKRGNCIARQRSGRGLRVRAAVGPQTPTRGSKANSAISARTPTVRRQASSSPRTCRSTACARSFRASCCIAKPPILTPCIRTTSGQRSRAADSPMIRP